MDGTRVCIQAGFDVMEDERRYCIVVITQVPYYGVI